MISDIMRALWSSQVVGVLDMFRLCHPMLINRALLAQREAFARSPLPLTHALTDALVRAAANVSFDLGIIEALISHGAKVSHLLLTDLFADSKTAGRTQRAVKQVEEAAELAALPAQAEGEGPWPEHLAYVMDGYLPGFALYNAKLGEAKQPGPSFFDLMWCVAGSQTATRALDPST